MTRPSDASVEMIRRLIGFDTTSRNSNLELIHWIRDYLKDLGVASDVVYNDERTKANLYATLGPTDRPGIALSGHTDVVPIDGQDWTRDPWQVAESDGKLFGRGTCDMKSFIAICLACAPKFAAAKLSEPVHFAFSYDEEVGCLGVRPLLAHLATKPVRPRMAIIGEPTDMKVINAHKGKLSHTCRVHGFECHSSLAPTGVNAIEYAARLIGKLIEMAEDKQRNGPFDENYDVPHTTVHTGVIQGGTALNIVPKDCWFDFEFRNLPADDPQALMKQVTDYAEQVLVPRMQAIRPNTGIEFELYSFFSGLDTPADHEVVQLTKALTGANSTSKVAFGTEAGLISEAGIPSVVCGPGSIEQAHKPDEFVSLEQVALCERFMERLIERLAA
ncbi:acetylornithine deacetylase [Tistlia consotensis]|uniref:Acetylornithine deacetylase n=1 Tax=Tistlia consotensis USBA 355 TaxID=560819 RepID=A0A1Y6B532_9PROT|nr:acetylornithine deacetylase [Tistlia consotensis]SME88201.1 acetylornithine deacetylase [Tistlia consotensis USBA 355]SNR24644.1 acetylornithine deacetylase [Tistlia consotensis]